MQITIDSAEPLEDVLRVVGAAFGATLTVAEPSGAAPRRQTRSQSERSGRRSTGGRRRGKAAPTVSSSAVREWARENGYSVSDRGRIPQNVVSAYAEAHKN